MIFVFTRVNCTVEFRFSVKKYAEFRPAVYFDSANTLFLVLNVSWMTNIRYLYGNVTESYVLLLNKWAEIPLLLAKKPQKSKRPTEWFYDDGYYEEILVVYFFFFFIVILWNKRVLFDLSAGWVEILKPSV